MKFAWVTRCIQSLFYFSLKISVLVLMTIYRKQKKTTKENLENFKSEELMRALKKFLEYQKELEELEQERSGSYADELLKLVYGIPLTSKLIGGCNAPIFKDAAEKILQLKQSLVETR